MKSSISVRTSILILGSVAIAIAAEPKREYYETTVAEARTCVEQAKRHEHHDALRGQEAVATKETAIALAVAVWSPIYGKDEIAGEAPYQAIRVDDCWFVTGSLGKGRLGGTAEAVIAAADGHFLVVSHGK